MNSSKNINLDIGPMPEHLKPNVVSIAVTERKTKLVNSMKNGFQPKEKITNVSAKSIMVTILVSLVYCSS